MVNLRATKVRVSVEVCATVIREPAHGIFCLASSVVPVARLEVCRFKSLQMMLFGFRALSSEKDD